jgi:uncharacterized membrane protein HdeD (DUF308 family)
MKKLPASDTTAKEKVRDPRKTGILKTFVASLLMIGLGFVMLLHPDFANPTVASILGWSMTGVGALLIAVSLLNWNIMGIPELLIGIAMAAVGIFIIIKPEFVAESFGRIIAIYVGFHGLLSLMDSGKLKKLDRNYLPHTIMGVVMIVVALLLIFVPVSTFWMIRTLGVLVAISGLGNLVLRSKFYLSLPKGRLTFEKAND